ncbi:MAG: tetratricopeptide repeat protein [Candidatus Omnitrophica bacterium]|nr:tetratricopeptide repeat protein [Candidatus Omnitrophota bacterium]MDD5352520.1 tetratricopeptide repeat protein [Candidatus Omnitrophota bacterium]MDD5550118.1 tetratricopeptide repeat protein [Candidatus Omnitrophota bacterium]
MNHKIRKMNLGKSVLFCLIGFMIFSFSRVFADKTMDPQALQYFNEGIEAQKSGNLDYATTLYTKAIYIKPNYAKAHNNLGTVYAQRRDYARAEEEYNTAVAIDPNYSIALKNLAVMYAERKDYEKFYEYWKRATGLSIYSPFLIDDEKEEDAED